MATMFTNFKFVNQSNQSSTGLLFSGTAANPHQLAEHLKVGMMVMAEVNPELDKQTYVRVVVATRGQATKFDVKNSTPGSYFNTVIVTVMANYDINVAFTEGN